MFTTLMLANGHTNMQVNKYNIYIISVQVLAFIWYFYDLTFRLLSTPYSPFTLYQLFKAFYDVDIKTWNVSFVLFAFLYQYGTFKTSLIKKS